MTDASSTTVPTAYERIAYVGLIHVFLVVGAAVAFFAGGDPGRTIVAPVMVALGLLTTVDLIRTGYRAVVVSHQGHTQ